MLTHQQKNIASAEEMRELAELTQFASSNAKAPNTLNSYASGWEDFELWCTQKGFQFLPADPYTVASYLSERAMKNWTGPSGRLRKPTLKEPLKLPSLCHRLWSIKFKHRQHGYSFDTGCNVIENLVSSLRRQNTSKEVRKDPLLLYDVLKMVDHLPANLTGIRDKAILLVGFVSAMRRSEIVSLKMIDLKFVEEGIEINLSWSKTGKRDIPIPFASNPKTCPVYALRAWLSAANITEGPIFRSIDRHGNIGDQTLSDATIALIVKRNSYVQEKIIRAIDNGSYVPSYAGYSLGSGFCTTAAMKGVPEHLIMAQAGHKKSDTTKKYIRIADKWSENAAKKIGL